MMDGGVSGETSSRSSFVWHLNHSKGLILEGVFVVQKNPRRRVSTFCVLCSKRMLQQLMPSSLHVSVPSANGSPSEMPYAKNSQQEATDSTITVSPAAVIICIKKV